MTAVKFSYNEAIAHGWAMTKKYLKTIVFFAFIYILFQAAGGTLEFFAGEDNIPRQQVSKLFENSTQADQFYQYLQDAGYINKYGDVQDKLQQVVTPTDLALPSELEERRTEIYSFLNHYRYRLPFDPSIFIGLSIILWLANMLISIGYFKVNIIISRDKQPSMADFFSNWRLLIPYLLGGICYGLAVLGGFILLIIPGFIFMIMFQFYPYLIIDKGLGPVASLKRSRAITKGSRIRLVTFGFLLMLLNLGGLLCLVVGLLFTISVSAIAMAYVYDRLEKSNNSPEITLRQDSYGTPEK